MRQGCGNASSMKKAGIAFPIFLAALLLPSEGRSQTPGPQWGVYAGNAQEGMHDFAEELGKTPPWQMIFVNVADGFPRGFAGNLAIFLEIGSWYFTEVIASARIRVAFSMAARFSVIFSYSQLERPVQE